MTRYCWRPGTRVTLEAQIVGSELEKIREDNRGRLLPEDVVKAAQPRTSPLHGAFEWDNKKAANRWRLEQASYLIRSIDIEAESMPAQRKPVRAFVSVIRDNSRSYTSIEHAMSKEELRAQVLHQAYQELVSWKVRHEELTEFAKLFTAIDEARPS